MNAGIFGENFPYTNFHDLNLDWIIKMIKGLNDKFDEAIAGRVTIADPPEWDITKQYPALTIVFDNGKAYLSMQPVPAGTVITDEDYWYNIFDVDDLFDMIEAETTARENADTALSGRITDEATARANADTALGGRITNETTARENADTALGGRITDQGTALGGRITDETTARENADTALGNRITNLENDTVKNNSTKHLLFCGDSYTNWYSGRLFNKFVQNVKIPAAQCHNLAVSGAAFTPGLAAQFITQVQNYAGNRSEITDILVAGGINDALIDYDTYTTTYPDTSITYNAMVTFYNYCRQEYPNAKIHLAYIGGCLVTSQYYESLHPAKAQEMALFLYTVGARDIGFNVLSCYHTIHLTQDYYSTDGLHPSEAGVDAIAQSLAIVFNGGYNIATRPYIKTAVNGSYVNEMAIPVIISITDNLVQMTLDGGYFTLASGAAFDDTRVRQVGQFAGSPNAMVKTGIKLSTTVLLNHFSCALSADTNYRPVPAQFRIENGCLYLNVFEINPNTGTYIQFTALANASITLTSGLTFTTELFNVN